MGDDVGGLHEALLAVPGSLRAWAMMLGGESFWKPWGALLECVQAGETAFHRVFGMGRGEYLAAHPDAAETFNRMSASNTDGRATPIVEASDFSAAPTIIDLGGGRGGLMAAILTKHPAVKACCPTGPPSLQRPKRSSTHKAWEHAVQYEGTTAWRRRPRAGTST